LSFAPGFEADVIVADLRDVADMKTIIDSMMCSYRSAYPEEQFSKIRIVEK